MGNLEKIAARRRLGVVSGLKFESEAVERGAARGGVADLLFASTGLGRESARRAAESLLADGATALLSFGIAAGLDPEITCGTAVVAAAIRAKDLPPLACAPTWSARVAYALAASGPAMRADIAHAPAVLATRADKAGLFAASGARAADMESYGVGEAASAAGVPFLAIRIIADTAHEALPSIAVQAMADDGTIDLSGTLRRIAGSPRQIPDLLRLGRSAARARARLAAVAAALAPTLFLADN